MGGDHYYTDIRLVQKPLWAEVTTSTDERGCTGIEEKKGRPSGMMPSDL